ncbi:MAG: hypothetical protein QXK06_02300 [Candidatus Diapherotrites archaeon]
MKSIDFSKPVTFSILSAMLEKQAFTQLSLSKEKGVSLGQVNKVAKYLSERNLIGKEQGAYALANPYGIIECIASFRNMKSALIGKMSVSLSKEEVLKLLGSRGVLCLDSALEQFQPNVSSKRVCAYVSKKEKKQLLEELESLAGENCQVWLYSEDLPIEEETVNGLRVTSRKRTAIDLVCDNAGFAASDLFKQLWNQEIL